MREQLIVIGFCMAIAAAVAAIQTILRLFRGGSRPGVQKEMASDEDQQRLLEEIEGCKILLQNGRNSKEFLTLDELYRKLGVSEDAVKILREGLKRRPHFVEARLALAKVELTQGHVEQARQELLQIVHCDSQHFFAHKLLGEIAMQQQDYEDAVVRFGAAYSLQPSEEEPKVMLEYLGSLLKRDVITQFQQGEEK